MCKSTHLFLSPIKNWELPFKYSDNWSLSSTPTGGSLRSFISSATGDLLTGVVGNWTRDFPQPKTVLYHWEMGLSSLSPLLSKTFSKMFMEFSNVSFSSGNGLNLSFGKQTDNNKKSKLYIAGWMTNWPLALSKTWSSFWITQSINGQPHGGKGWIFIREGLWNIAMPTGKSALYIPSPKFRLYKIQGFLDLLATLINDVIITWGTAVT